MSDGGEREGPQRGERERGPTKRREREGPQRGERDREGHKETKVMIHRTVHPNPRVCLVGLQCHYKWPTMVIIIFESLYKKKVERMREERKLELMIKM